VADPTVTNKSVTNFIPDKDLAVSPIFTSKVNKSFVQFEDTETRQPDKTKFINSPETCRSWLLKLHKTPQKNIPDNGNEFAQKPHETPESASKKVER